MTTKELMTAIQQDFYDKIQDNYEFPVSQREDNYDALTQWYKMEVIPEYFIFKEQRHQLLINNSKDMTIAIENTSDQDYEVELWSDENLIHSFYLCSNTVNWVLEGYFIPTTRLYYDTTLHFKFKINGEYVNPDEPTIFLYSVLLSGVHRRNLVKEKKVFPMIDKRIYFHYGNCNTYDEGDVIYEPFPHSLTPFEYVLK